MSMDRVSTEPFKKLVLKLWANIKFITYRSLGAVGYFIGSIPKPPPQSVSLVSD